MKNRLFVLLLITALMVPALAGCQTAENRVEAAGNAVESKAESVGETLKEAVGTATAPRTAPAPDTVPAASTENAITIEVAQDIALKHAGFTADQVTHLYAEYEIEHGVPRYDVEFHEGHWEYDYEIHAGTGEILSFEKDD